MRHVRLTALLALTLILAACASAQIAQSNRGSYVGPPIHALAVAPGGGALAAAIGVELFNDGVTVIAPDQTKAILGHAGIADFEITSPDGYAALRKAGVDAVLVVKGVMGQDGTPESAAARITLTSNGTVVAGVVWQNGWGGQRGSIADRTMRKNLAGAASEIAATLFARMK